MAKDITISNASFEGVPSIFLPKTDGTGFAEFIDSDDVPPEQFKYSGFNPEKFMDLTFDWTLRNDTDFPFGNANSTNSVIVKPIISNYISTDIPSPTITIGDKDVFIKQTIHIIPEYDGTESQDAIELQFTGEYLTWYTKRLNPATMKKYTRQNFLMSFYLMDIINNKGVRANVSSQYGVCSSIQAPSINSSTAAKTYIKCNAPSISYRAQTSYAKPENMNKIIDASIRWTFEAWLLDESSVFTNVLINDVERMLGYSATPMLLDIDGPDLEEMPEEGME